MRTEVGSPSHISGAVPRSFVPPALEAHEYEWPGGAEKIHDAALDTFCVDTFCVAALQTASLGLGAHSSASQTRARRDTSNSDLIVQKRAQSEKQTVKLAKLTERIHWTLCF